MANEWKVKCSGCGGEYWSARSCGCGHEKPRAQKMYYEKTREELIAQNEAEVRTNLAKLRRMREDY